ncbi:unnamed protein product [Oncorhynchus mykiss]|uniref:Uncharacterized protein n=1 Tax=Oncorhynchus mykiss TaxID=8022 RepID=A0A060WWW5_ONCMY|nr:unnamed protein product [Oncorhynchus mykiss]
MLPITHPFTLRPIYPFHQFVLLSPTFLSRTVRPEDKSFAVGVQYMLFRVLAFLPAPVLYGTAIDTTCIIWGKKCGRNTSCHYYNMDLFRQRQEPTDMSAMSTILESI